MADITGIGANVYDTLIKLAEFPTEDTKVCVETVVTSGGGPTGTGLVAAAKLGASCSIVAVLSTDTGGQFLMSDYVKYGVKTDFIEVRDGESFSATVLLNSATGSRTCLLNRGTLPKLTLNDAQIAEILGSKVFMVDGNELEAATRVAEMVQKNRETGRSATKILYDAGGRYPGVEKLLPLVDILIPSAEFARSFTGKEMLEEAVRKLFAQ
ncbi:MAG: PfkB family carbohydrate kinase, partial [Planctomycetia bacterium]|nr:PfkB family carbohydrate kinase [Planctomycetia bacterium]